MDKKELFQYEYPQFLKFRGELNSKIHKDYNAWRADLLPASGVIRNFFGYIKGKTSPEVLDWLIDFNTECPEKYLSLHFNGQARAVNEYPEVCELYFPGHWVYEPGGKLLENIDEEQTVFQVENIERFKEKQYADRAKNPIEWTPTYVLLVKLGDEGNRLWYESEIAHVKIIDKVNSKLTVERGKTNTTSKKFEAGKTYVAPIAGGIWGEVKFYYNFSSCCPKDKDGKTAADIFVGEFNEWYNEGGPLNVLDGLAIDVNFFSATQYKTWDVNNDGIADAGIINGNNVWREGDWKLLKDLRTALGPDVIVTADGQHEGNQQAVGVLNGIESEGLVQHNDSWRGFSRATNTHEYWRKFNNLPYPFRYVVLKFQNANDAANIDRLRRFSVASACALEAYNTYPDDFDFLPAWVKSKSLGKAKGELIRVAKQSPKLLSDNINTIGETYLNAIDCKVEYTPEGIILSAKSDAQTSLSFEFKNMDLPAGDLTFFIDSKSLDPLHGFTNEDRVPRILYTEFSNLPDYGEGVNVNKLYTDLYGMIGTYDFYENAFYYRRPKVEAGKQTLKFKVDGGGKILIRAFQAYNKPDILIKEFEHAIVCVNPSLEAQSVNLTTDKLPGLNANKSIIVDPVDAVFLKNINTGNTGFIEANEQNPGKTKILKINGGMHSFNFKNTKAQINIWDITGRKIKSSEINNDKILFHLPENNLYMVQIITV